MWSLQTGAQRPDQRTLYGMPDVADSQARAAVRASAVTGSPRATRVLLRDPAGRPTRLYLARGTELRARPGQLAAYSVGATRHAPGMEPVDQYGPRGSAGRSTER